jgi:hypothetical protein
MATRGVIAPMKTNNRNRGYPISSGTVVGNKTLHEQRYKHMKNQIIHITSLANATKVTIRNGQKKLKARRFRSIDEAIAFVLPRGNRQTNLNLNGYPCVLHGWVQ